MLSLLRRSVDLTCRIRNQSSDTVAFVETLLGKGKAGCLAPVQVGRPKCQRQPTPTDQPLNSYSTIQQDVLWADTFQRNI
ncbi:hypothetical protein MHYP_G00318300 [Metynnis hypsauchen]